MLTLSRLPDDTAPPFKEEMSLFIAEDQRGRIMNLQEEDRFLTPILSHLQRPEEPTNREVRRAARAFSLLDGVLFRRAKGCQEHKLALAVPRNLRREILVSCHDDITAGHLGIRTLDKIRQRYFWPKMFSISQSTFRPVLTARPERHHPQGQPAYCSPFRQHSDCSRE